MEEISFKKKHIWYALLLVVAIIAIWPWFSEGVPATDDFRGQSSITWHVKESILTKGHIVFWMPQLYSGWPVFEFYPIAQYILSLPIVLATDAITALKYSSMLAFVLAALTMFYSARLLFKDEEIAFISAVSYTFFTYHFIDLNIRGAFSELWGYAIFPLATVWMILAINTFSKKNVIIASLFSALLILIHFPTAYMAFLTILIYLIYKTLVDKSIKLSVVKSISIIGILTLLLAAFWLVPFLTESKNANFGDEISQNGKLKLFGAGPLESNDAVPLKEIFSRNFGKYNDGSRTGTYFYIGFSLIALFVLGFFYKNELVRFFMYLGSFFVLVNLIPLLLNILPLAIIVHFKFRFFLIIAFALSLVAGASAVAIINSIKAIKKEHKTFAVLFVAAIIVIDFFPAVNAVYWVSQPTENFINDPAQIDVLKKISYEPGYFLVFAPTAQTAFLYHKKFDMGWDWDGQREGAVGAVQNNYTTDGFAFFNGLKNGNINQSYIASQKMGYYGVKYLVLPCIKDLEKIYPIAYTNNAYCVYANPFFRPLVETTNGTISDLKFDINMVTFKSKSEETATILLKVSNFEGHWFAYVDNTKVAIKDAFPKYMQITVPKGAHEIRFEYKQTQIQKIAAAISILTLLIISLIYFDFHKKWLHKKQKEIKKSKAQK